MKTLGTDVRFVLCSCTLHSIVCEFNKRGLRKASVQADLDQLSSQCRALRELI